MRRARPRARGRPPEGRKARPAPAGGGGEATATGYLVELRLVPDALADPRLGPGALALIVAAGRSALGFDPEPRECFCCCRPWSPARHLVAVLAVEVPGEEAGLLAGVCRACAGSGRVRELVVAGLERDLGPASEIRTVHPEARA